MRNLGNSGEDTSQGGKQINGIFCRCYQHWENNTTLVSSTTRLSQLLIQLLGRDLEAVMKSAASAASLMTAMQSSWTMAADCSLAVSFLGLCGSYLDGRHLESKLFIRLTVCPTVYGSTVRQNLE